MTKYCWGSATAEFKNCVSGPLFREDKPNSLFVDGKEIWRVDYVDTEHREYRYIKSNEDGIAIVSDDGEDLIRIIGRARESMKLILAGEVVFDWKKEEG